MARHLWMGGPLLRRGRTSQEKGSWKGRRLVECRSVSGFPGRNMGLIWRKLKSNKLERCFIAWEMMHFHETSTCYQESSPGQSICQIPLSLLGPWLITCNFLFRFMTDAARREQESLKKKIQPKLSLTLSSSVSRGNVSTPPRHSSGSLTPPVTPPITPSSSFRSSTPTGKPQLGTQLRSSVG